MFVIMFHSVGNDQSNWYRRWLSVSLQHFDTFCLYLHQNNYSTHFLNEWYDYFSINQEKKKKQLVLTFDDGYLDNWVYIYPILKKYNLKGTIFINPEFVDPSTDVRSNLDDVWAGRKSMSELQTLGFLSWTEIQAMDKSGVMDIQSHSMSHNFYFNSDKIKDIYEGQDNYDWLAWFHRPERKPFYVTEVQKGFVPTGFPVFEFGRALGLRRYFPDEQMIEYAVKLHDTKNDGKDKSSRINLLNEKVKEFPGRFETDEEMEKRYRYELFESKRLLEEKLDKKVEFLCWPGGGYNELSIRLSIEAGYKTSTIGSIEPLSNIRFSTYYKRIIRFGMASFISTKKGYKYIKQKNHLVNILKARTGNLSMRIMLKLKKELIKQMNNY